MNLLRSALLFCLIPGLAFAIEQANLGHSKLAVGTTSLVYIRDNGVPRLGIGTTAPKARLDIRGSGYLIRFTENVKGIHSSGALEVDSFFIQSQYKSGAQEAESGLIFGNSYSNSDLDSSKWDDSESTVFSVYGSAFGFGPVVPSLTATVEVSHELRTNAPNPVIAKPNNSIPTFLGTQNGGTGFAEFTFEKSGSSGTLFNGSVTYTKNGTQITDTFTVGKTFVIDHPTDASRYLVHSAIEGPSNDVFYSGQAQLIDGKATIVLPDYVAAFTKPESATFRFTAIDGFDALAVPDGLAKEGRFVVYADNPGSQQRFDWELKLTRRDIADLAVEPMKGDLKVSSFGPYSYFDEENRP